MIYSSLITSVCKILTLVFVVYITQYSQITKDTKYRYPFWMSVFISIITLFVIRWELPLLRMYLVVVFMLLIFSIYFLHFLKRQKTTLDFIKLGAIFLFAIDNLTINTMRYLYGKGYITPLINKETTNTLSDIFNIAFMCILGLIAFIIYRNRREMVGMNKSVATDS